MYVCVYVCSLCFGLVCVYAYVDVRVCSCLSVCACEYWCVCVCVCVCVIRVQYCRRIADGLRVWINGRVNAIRASARK